MPVVCTPRLVSAEDGGEHYLALIVGQLLLLFQMLQHSGISSRLWRSTH
jgi:hypothetical protein